MQYQRTAPCLRVDVVLLAGQDDDVGARNPLCDASEIRWKAMDATNGHWRAERPVRR
ncbi:hypothetical protein [Microbispora sp. GKU 823]|uniref:hypothetical protein n=1 Tax=Microbispora sp. GKU 823 TaxID=1652100 RepID=UPI0015C4C45E|nr:hypothetical protein [Microbispora sp. GKU 823]